MVAGFGEVIEREETLVAEACNHPNCLVLLFRLEMNRLARASAHDHVFAITSGVAENTEILRHKGDQASRQVYVFRSGCSETLKVFPSGSLNQATFAPVGEIQMPSSSWSIPP
jgi:hypothetical protein